MQLSAEVPDCPGRRFQSLPSLCRSPPASQSFACGMAVFCVRDEV